MSSPSVSIEIVRRDRVGGPFAAALLDFDGTLSLVRRNWQDVMVPMMVDHLLATGTGEPRAALAAHVEQFVMQLNGQPTIFQMMRLAEEVAARGGSPRDPEEYHEQYQRLLLAQVERRLREVREGRRPVDDLLVPGARSLLAQLRERGVALYLASGTELDHVRAELDLLGLAAFFGPHVYGPRGLDRQFSKRQVIEQILAEQRIPGAQLVGLGDGVVETREMRAAGGLAVGVASDEERQCGVNPWKRERLIEAGADVIIGDFRCHAALLAEVLGLQT